MDKMRNNLSDTGISRNPAGRIRSSAAEYLTFVASTGGSEASFEMRYEDENIWLTQKMMAALYDVSVSAINQHLKKVFEDAELQENAVIKKYLITAEDGKKYNTKHYNLQAIIAVGFKVNNQRAVQFRKWAGQIVKDHTIQGWSMDAERMKKGHMFTDEYFERQLQLVREIRLSERKFYQKVTDLYATAFDYDKSAKTTRIFFKTVQNKMHFAVHRHTAAELIVERADASKAHMGLTTWENAPDGKILKADVTIAKNYLSKEEMDYLERIVSLYLDYAELQAQRKIPMSMEDWARRLDGFLEFNGNELLTGPGKISAEKAKLHAECEYEKYRVVQDHLYESDFDKFLLKEEGTKMSEFIFVCYPRCTTCKKAEKWLADNGIEVQVRDIKENNPTEQEIRSWHEKSGLPLKRFFNTSGLRYKELELKNKLSAMSEEEQYALLATDGMLVKRPLLVGDDKVLVGFKEKEWQENLL